MKRSPYIYYNTTIQLNPDSDIFFVIAFKSDINKYSICSDDLATQTVHIVATHTVSTNGLEGIPAKGFGRLNLPKGKYKLLFAVSNATENDYNIFGGKAKLDEALNNFNLKSTFEHEILIIRKVS